MFYIKINNNNNDNNTKNKNVSKQDPPKTRNK